MSQYIVAAHWSDLNLSGWRWPHFSPWEMRCKGTGGVKLYIPFMDFLEDLRADCGFALPVSSGYRSPWHNNRVSKSGFRGPHTTGKAGDVQCHTQKAYWVQRHAHARGATGVGSRQTGKFSARFIHVDIVRQNPHIPRPMVWGYA